MGWWCHAGGTKAGVVGGIVVVVVGVVGVVMLDAAAEEDKSISHNSGLRLRRLLVLPLILAGCVCVCACRAWSCGVCDAGDGDRRVMVLPAKLAARIYLECFSVCVCVCMRMSV